MSILSVGTRGSQLALFQANAVADLLRQRAGVACDIVVIKTSGDRLAEATLSQIGGKRLFVKEIEDALSAGAIDLAVHSSKDMPAVLPDGLEVAAVLPREDARDAVILPNAAGSTWSLEEIADRLGRAPRIGTSSVRRSAQLHRLFPGASFLPIRGNLDTRLRKLDTGDYDALILAAAGLRRLERGDRISALIPVDACVPAPGQGIIAVEIRSSDRRVRDSVAAIDDPRAAAELIAERAVVTSLGGGCQMPLGAHATTTAETITVTGIVISLDGARVARATASGPSGSPEAVGSDVANQLLAAGADAILAEVRRTHAPVEGLQP